MRKNIEILLMDLSSAGIRNIFLQILIYGNIF
jgi:hypothetical protein